MENYEKIKNEVQKRKSLERAIENTELSDISKRIFDSSPLGDSLEQILDFDHSDLDLDFQQKKGSKNTPKTPLFDANSDFKNPNFEETKNTENKKSPKTSRKMQLELKAKSIEKRIGNIESIRINLDLNKKEFSDLLMVDPSAMNRWCKGEANAPAYIYQALEWYLLAIEKHPLLGKSLWLKSSDLVDSLKDHDLEKIASKIGLKEARENSNFNDSNLYKKISFLLFALFLLLLFKILFT